MEAAEPINEMWSEHEGTWSVEVSTLSCLTGEIKLPNGQSFPTLKALLNACEPCHGHGELTHWVLGDNIIIWND